jgi:hypothetical protein
MTNSAAASPAIPNQVTLPFNVAFEVVLQGFRIRFGRSLVTITGVIFGIAFLMSIFTGLVLKSGVSSEEKLRIETNGMYSFLIAESGLPAGHVMGLIVDSPLRPAETRLLQELDEQGLSELRVAAPAGMVLPPLSKAKLTRVSPDALGDGTSAILWTGEEVPAIGWDAVFKGARQDVLSLTRAVDVVPPSANIHLVKLVSSPSDEKKARELAEAKKTRMRNGWIIIISLLVTIIGISNAMLMSVTERFREIGTMKCLGALSSFVRRMFLIESGLMGLVGGLIGCLVGLVFSLIAYSITYGVSLAFLSLWQGFAALLLYSLLSLGAGLILSVVAALYPASVASNMVPATALRSNI